MTKISRDLAAAMPVGPSDLALALDALPRATPAFAAAIMTSIQCMYAIEELAQ